eukprot:gene35097-55263_t
MPACARLCSVWNCVVARSLRPTDTPDEEELKRAAVPAY